MHKVLINPPRSKKDVENCHALVDKNMLYVNSQYNPNSFQKY